MLPSLPQYMVSQSSVDSQLDLLLSIRYQLPVAEYHLIIIPTASYCDAKCEPNTNHNTRNLKPQSLQQTLP